MLKTVFTLSVLLISFLGYSQTRTIHIVVSLCDNLNQGIVPVPQKIGNGQDPGNNLYWGCEYGVKTYFKKQPDWKLIYTQTKSSENILERLVFKHKDSSVYIVADAYDGAKIEQATVDFLKYSAGLSPIDILVDSTHILCGGKSNLLCYVGHNLLMDYKLDIFPSKDNSERREVIILACNSKPYFSSYIKNTGAYPLLWTTNLMCPEAYTLDTAIDNWIMYQKPMVIREKSAQTYHLFQKCGIQSAKNLLETGY